MILAKKKYYYTNKLKLNNVFFFLGLIGSLNVYAENPQSLNKQNQINYVTSHPADFCKRNMLLRYAKTQENNLNTSNASLYILPTEELERSVSKKIFMEKTFKVPDSPWEFSLIPTNETLEKSVNLLNWEPTKWNKYLGLDEKALIDYISSNDSETGNVDILSTINSVLTQKPIEQTPESLEISVEKRIACAELTILKNSDCLEALKYTKNYMEPFFVNGYQMMNIELWKKVLANQKYSEGLKLAAQKMYNREHGDLNLDDNLFDDLINSYKESGFSLKDAQENTWDVLGLIANGGANTWFRVRSLADIPNKSGFALSYIASAMRYIDFKKQKLGMPLYSYPRNIITACDNSKSYYFWMSAYITREMVKHGIDPFAAAAGTFTAQKGYQITRNILKGKKNKMNTIFQQGVFSPTSQIIRTDLAYSAAGVFYGVQSLNSNFTQINVNAALRQLIIEASEDTKIWNSNESDYSNAEAYLLFSKAFSPNSAFKNIQSQLGY